MIAARWIRIDPRIFGAVCNGLAAVQSADGAPIVLWCAPQDGWCRYAFIVPLRHAPGREDRRIAWALAPVLAAWRSLGVAAYLEGGDVLRGGSIIGAAASATQAGCAVVVARAGCLPEWAGEAVLAERLRLIVEAQYGWQFDTSWPAIAEWQSIEEHY